MIRALVIFVAIAGCKPGGIQHANELCAKAAAMFDQCETRDGATAQEWEIALDRWRGLCRASLTGETAQLMPNARELWEAMPDEVRAGLRVQAECGAAATTCAQYAACDE